MPAERGRDWRRIDETQVWTDKPRWSPDGPLLYYLRRDARARFNVWATRIDPSTDATVGRPFQITRFDQPTCSSHPMSIVPR